MVISELKGKTIFLDTAPLIYFIEGHSEFQKTLKELFTLIDSGEILAITSTITLLEVLVKPLRENRSDLVNKYNDILTSAKGLDICDLNISIAKEAASLRSKYNLKTPDSIQIATAKVYSAEYFITNDLQLKSISEVKALVISDLK
jgi:predicted nucleic acid-binding protein